MKHYEDSLSQYCFTPDSAVKGTIRYSVKRPVLLQESTGVLLSHHVEFGDHAQHASEL